MPEESKTKELPVEPAWLIELEDNLSNEKEKGKKVRVQFNPESLKLSYANQLQTQSNGGASPPPAGNQAHGTPSQQFVGAGTTKLAVQLWFDVSAATAPPFMVDDVRRLTAEVLYFMKPRKPEGSAADTAQRTPPGVRFSWGNFLFNGIVESMEENIEFFSNTGNALRASMTLNLIQQDILVPAFVTQQAGTPGTRPLWPAEGGQSLQQMAGGTPISGSGKSTASGSGSGSGGGPTGAPGGSFGAGLGGGFAAGASGALARGAGIGPGGSTPAGGAAFQAGGWQRVALANGIENPRALAPGQLIDLQARKPRIVTG